jgi:hypothetical protein
MAQGPVKTRAERRARDRMHRRRVLVGLLTAACATLLFAVVASQPSAWVIQVFADVLLVGYVAMLIRARNVSAALEMSHRALDR